MILQELLDGFQWDDGRQADDNEGFLITSVNVGTWGSFPHFQ